ncbi:hypothetical protein REPUB_Repub09cG0091400 [Reevesia pubescens]
MGENAATKNQHQVFDDSIDIHSPQNGSECFDDDGRLKRTGTLYTASAHIITAVIESGVLSLAWAIAQLGWIAGPAVMFLFSFVTYYTSSLLTDCYRTGGYKVKACGLIQYLKLFGISIGYTIAASISMIFWSDMVALNFGCIFTYSGIGLDLGIAKVAATETFRGSLTGISIGTVTQAQKIWRSFQALGDIAFAYSFPIIRIEIQDTVKSPPAEAKTMKKATKLSIAVTTAFYMLCGCMGYAFFGDFTPGNLLTGFDGLKATLSLKSSKSQSLVIILTKLNLFKLVWRTVFVMLTTVISMLLPFFNDVMGILGALGFSPLTVYFPVEMHIQQKKISKWSSRWICLKMLSMACLMILIVAGTGSIVGVILDLKVYKPFKPTY